MEATANPEIPEFTVFFSNALKDPLGVTRLTSEAIRILGYPIQFKDDAVDSTGVPINDYLRVTTDIRDSLTKIFQLTSQIRHFPAQTEEPRFSNRHTALSFMTLTA